MPRRWTDDMDAELERLFRAGWSMTQIARRLSTPSAPITRNSVVGRCWRIGLRAEHRNSDEPVAAPVTMPEPRPAPPPPAPPAPAPGTTKATLPGGDRLKTAHRTRTERPEPAPASEPLRKPPVHPEAPTMGKKPRIGTVFDRLDMAGVYTAQPTTPRGSGPVSILDLEAGQCRYPVEDGPAGAHRFCGAPAKVGSSYCPKHHARCVVTSEAYELAPSCPPPADIPADVWSMAMKAIARQAKTYAGVRVLAAHGYRVAGQRVGVIIHNHAKAVSETG